MTHEIFNVVRSTPTPQGHVQILKSLEMLKQRKLHIVWLIQQKTPSFILPQILIPNHQWSQRAPLDYSWSVAIGLPPRWLINFPTEDHVHVPLLKNQITQSHLSVLILDSKYKKIQSRHSHLESHTLRNIRLISSYENTQEHSTASHITRSKSSSASWVKHYFCSFQWQP